MTTPADALPIEAAARPYLRMACNNAWANATLHAAVAALAEGAFAAPRPGFFGAIDATLNHILQVDHYYLDAVEQGGRGRTVYDAPKHTDLAPLTRQQAETDRRLIAFCRALSPDRLALSVITERPDGPHREEIAALLLHLFQHQVHHRGQVHTMLSHAGATPPQLDDFHLDYGRVPSAMAYWT